MKKILIFASIVTTILSASSCKKEQSENNTIDKNPLSSLVNLYQSTDADFFVTVSSSYGVSLFDNNQFSVNRASTVIEAASKDEIQVGTLKVNNTNIPFSALSYGLETSSQFTPSNVLGLTNTYQLTGNNFPSFNLTGYSPTVTHLSYTGLQNNKLSRNTPLGISWNPDNQLPQNGKALVILYAENDVTGTSVTVELSVNDNTGGINIPVTELNKFASYPYVRVFYARGYNKLQTIGGKTIDLRFVNFSYSRIYFTQ